MGLASFNKMRRENLNKKTVQELRKKAALKGIKNVNRKKKKELIKELS